MLDPLKYLKAERPNIHQNDLELYDSHIENKVPSVYQKTKNPSIESVESGREKLMPSQLGAQARSARTVL